MGWISSALMIGMVLANEPPREVSPHTPLSRVAQKAQAAGFHTCLVMLDRMVKTVHSDDSSYGLNVHMAKESPDTSIHVFTADTEANVLTVFNASKTIHNTCDISFDSSLVVSASCEAALKDFQSQWTFLSKMTETTSAYQSDLANLTTVYMSEIGIDHCLIERDFSAFGISPVDRSP